MPPPRGGREVPCTSLWAENLPNFMHIRFLAHFCLIQIKIWFRIPLAVSRAPKIWVLGMFK